MAVDDEYKKRIMQKINNFSKKNEPKPTGRKNDKPESRVENEIFHALNSAGWSIEFYESKAVYNPDAGFYLNSKVRPGHSDLAGSSPLGESVWIEVKAPGKRSTLSEQQKDFLIEKINVNAFAICSDSLEYVLDVYNRWRKSEFKKSLLLKELPAKKKPPESKGDHGGNDSDYFEF